MKKLLMIALVLSVLFVSCESEPYTEATKTSVWDGKITTAWYDDNKDATEFTILSASDLAGLANLVNREEESVSFEGKTIKLSVNIDLAENPWTPIGIGKRDGKGYTTDSKVFKGTFDGNGLSILNLKIDDEATSNCIGFFGVVDGATIKNIRFVSSKINTPGSDTVGTAVGLLVNNSEVSKISVDSNSSVKAKEAGGLLGRMTVSGSITDCINEADVTTTAGGVGGIIGKAYYSEEGKEIVIKNCENKGSITTDGGYAGGIAGLLAGNLSDCKNFGAVVGKSTSIGGIVGEFTNYGVIENSINAGKVENPSEIDSLYGLGGIVGWVRYQTSNYEKNSPVEVKNNTNIGIVSGKASAGVGGIVGMLFNTGKVTENTNNAESLSGKLFVSGIVGAHQVASNNLFNDEEKVKATVVSGNNSTTAKEKISGGCSATIIYINDARIKENVKDNTPENEVIRVVSE